MALAARLVAALVVALVVAAGTRTAGSPATAVLFVPSLDGNSNPSNASDQRLLLFLESLGLSVQVEVLRVSTPELEDPNALIVVPGSNADDVGRRLLFGTPNPALLFNRGSWAAAGLLPEEGLYTTAANITITSTSHPIVAGLAAGGAALYDRAATVYWAQPDQFLGNVSVLATVEGSPDKAAVFATGAQPGTGRATVGAPAVGRRVGIGMFYDGFAIASDVLRFLISRSVDWLLAQPRALGAPEQVLLAYGATPSSEMVVTWGSRLAHAGDLTNATSAVVRYRECGDQGPWAVATGTVARFRQTAQARVALSRLWAGQCYEYLCSYGAGASTALRTFTTAPARPTRQRLALFGDLGYTCNQILPYLRQEVQAGDIDAIVLFGDMVYWWSTDDGRAADSFMRDLSNMTNASVPLHVSPGNGEAEGNFSDYKARFSMPHAESENMWHSVNIGYAHVVGLSTESLGYWPDQDSGVRGRMLAWAEQDLAWAAAPENRTQRPWIVVHFHRPVYSTWGDPEGDPKPRDFLEELLYRHGVDLVFAGHVHNQERTFPTYNGTVYGTDYHNAKAPVYIVSGNPSNAEETDIFSTGFKAWTAYRSYQFGYTHLTIHNGSAMEVDFLSTQLGGQITDSVMMTKSKPACFGGRAQACGDHGARPAALPPQPRLPTPRIRRPLYLATETPAPVPEAQRTALVRLYHATNGSGWRLRTHWLEGDPCAQGWYGVSCVVQADRFIPPPTGGAPGVTAIQLSSNGLVGQLPDVFAAFRDTLQVLDLSSNQLGGTAIPASALQLPGLHTLFLSPRTDDAAFKFRGELPSSLGNASGLPSLVYLGLERNLLTGGVPHVGAESCHLPSAGPTAPACLIWLFNNSLDGRIDPGFCRSTYAELYLAPNPLTCPIPCLHAAYSRLPTCTAPCTPCPPP